MKRMAVLPAFVLVTLVAAACAAILGDGTRSLYTGQPLLGDPGRGACEVDGRTYPSETAVPRDHPCHYCICYQGQVSCYWKSCGPAPEGCSVMYFEGACNPGLYKCTVPKMSMAEPQFGARIRPLRKSRFRRALGPGLAFPPNSTLAQYGAPRMALPVDEPFPVEISEELLESVSRHRARRDKTSLVFWQPKDRSCTVLGVKYNLGEVIGVASDPCMECRCAAGDLFCSPRCCFLPAPLTPNRLQVQQHEQQVLYQVSNQPPPHPLYNIRNQVMPGNAL